MKGTTLTFLRKFFSTLRYLKTKPYSFIALDISTPKNIRKKLLILFQHFSYLKNLNLKRSCLILSTIKYLMDVELENKFV